MVFGHSMYILVVQALLMLGRSGTVVHELGHWFALYHPWGSKNLVGSDPVSADCDRSDNNDFVDDTPKTIGNKTCNTSAKYL
jgi:hypothetical protein